MRLYLLVLLALASQCTSERRDPGLYGPKIELVHEYYDQWPTGIAVSSKGRMFSNYPPGLDPGNTNDGKNHKYTVAELIGKDKEVPYPSAEMNNPPGGQINCTTNPPSGANYEHYLIGVQSVVIDSKDRLWILDTGRAIPTGGGALVYASPGGPKLIGIDLSADKVFQTIVFPPTVAYPDSYLNDVRFDLRPDITKSGKGVAYITDSSTEGRCGLIVVDLGTGESWRHLEGNPAVHGQGQFVGWLWGMSLYSNVNGSRGFIGVGSDGIALSADGEELFWGAVGSRYLYSVPTANLRAHAGATDDILAQGALRNRAQKGFSDGFETDSNNRVYVGHFEQNAIAFFEPKNGTVQTFVRDPHINWVDTMSVAIDGYLYFTNNQLSFFMFTAGQDDRIKPYALYRAKLPDGGTKVR